MVVAESHIQCQNEVLPTLNTLKPGNKTLYLCPWNKKLRLIHYQFVKNLDKCAIVPEKSLYLLNGSWKRRPRHDPALSKLVVEIGQDPGFPNNRLFLKVSEFSSVQFSSVSAAKCNIILQVEQQSLLQGKCLMSNQDTDRFTRHNSRVFL